MLFFKGQWGGRSGIYWHFSHNYLQYRRSLLAYSRNFKVSIPLNFACISNDAVSVIWSVFSWLLSITSLATFQSNQRINYLPCWKSSETFANLTPAQILLKDCCTRSHCQSGDFSHWHANIDKLVKLYINLKSKKLYYTYFTQAFFSIKFKLIIQIYV